MSQAGFDSPFLQQLIIIVLFAILLGMTLGVIEGVARKIINYYSQPENLKAYKGKFFHQLAYKVCQLVYKALQRLEGRLPTWLFLFLFTSFLILCISLFFEPGTFWSAFWDGLVNLPSTIWGWLLNILSPIWDLPWYVLLGGFIAWFVIGNILFLIFDLQGTIFKCEVCHTELIRRFLYFIETKRASYSPLDLKRKGDRHSRRALSRINKRRNKFSDEDWKRIFNRRERLLIHLKLIERRKPKRFGVIKYVYEKNLNHYDKLEHVLFLLSIGVINIFVYSFMQPTCPKCGEIKWLEGGYGYEGGSAINWRKLAKEKENDKQQKP
jgi:hypothetical protein